MTNKSKDARQMPIDRALRILAKTYAPPAIPTKKQAEVIAALREVRIRRNAGGYC